MPDAPVASSFVLNPYDVGVVVLLLLSALFAVLRGFTREILSIGGWTGAILGTLYGYPLCREYFRAWIGNIMFGDIVTVILLFVTLLVVLTSLIRSLSDRVKSSKLGGLDRSLGLLFGVFRGGVLVVGAFFLSLFIWKVPQARPPELQKARALPYVIWGAEAFVSVLPTGLIPPKMVANFGRSQERPPQDLVKSLSRPQLQPRPRSQTQFRSRSQSQPLSYPKEDEAPSSSLKSPETQDRKSSYAPSSRQGMNRLFKAYN